MIQAVVEKKKLAKQKAELISGFKSQMKLIDVLKRQVGGGPKILGRETFTAGDPSPSRQDAVHHRAGVHQGAGAGRLDLEQGVG
eukprot:749359-Hanusia_phi.AAC.6